MLFCTSELFPNGTKCLIINQRLDPELAQHLLIVFRLKWSNLAVNQSKEPQDSKSCFQTGHSAPFYSNGILFIDSIYIFARTHWTRCLLPEFAVHMSISCHLLVCCRWKRRRQRWQKTASTHFNSKILYSSYSSNSENFEEFHHSKNREYSWLTESSLLQSKQWLPPRENLQKTSGQCWRRERWMREQAESERGRHSWREFGKCRNMQDCTTCKTVQHARLYIIQDCTTW
jgi:hypothetical protein